jgi:ribonucleotide reductase beta subunit family protein with ferritin-like domain
MEPTDSLFVPASLPSPAIEPLLIPDEGRYVMFPIKYNDVWTMYKKQMDSFWRCEEINMSKDIGEWEKMNENEKYFIKMVLAFFAASDGIVLENLAQRFMNDIENSEIRAFYSMQIFMENIHCVSGGTAILTNHGYKKISSLVNKDVQVWNGVEFSAVTVKYTGNQVLHRVILTNGIMLDCTPGHKWVVYDKDGAVCKIPTTELNIQSEIVTFEYPVLESLLDEEEMNEPYYYGKQIAECTMMECDTTTIFIPINYSIETKTHWLNGFLKHGGELCHGNDTKIIRIPSVHAGLLYKLQLLFSTMGIFTTRYSIDEDCEYLLLMDKYFPILLKYGVNPDDIKIQITDEGMVKDAILVANEPIRILDIYKVDDDAPTYCFNEPKQHCGVFNGILTGQSEMYSILIDTYSKNKEEKDKLFNAIKHFPCIRKKAEWAKRWINDKDASFASRLTGFAIVEGIFFSSSFASIYWIKKRGMLQGLTLSNEFISRDEALHVEFAVLLYHKLENKLSSETFYKIMADAVEIEKEFILEAIPCRLIGMNSGLMSQYIEFVANRLCLQLGYDKLFPLATNPFDFMELISLNDKVNFFEKTNTQYALANKVIDGDPFDLSGDF